MRKFQNLPQNELYGYSENMTYPIGYVDQALKKYISADIIDLVLQLLNLRLKMNIIIKNPDEEKHDDQIDVNCSPTAYSVKYCVKHLVINIVTIDTDTVSAYSKYINGQILPKDLEKLCLDDDPSLIFGSGCTITILSKEVYVFTDVDYSECYCDYSYDCSCNYYKDANLDNKVLSKDFSRLDGEILCCSVRRQIVYKPS
jgi:hypothetical protein